jgi:hypothetical protein
VEMELDFICGTQDDISIDIVKRKLCGPFLWRSPRKKIVLCHSECVHDVLTSEAKTVCKLLLGFEFVLIDQEPDSLLSCDSGIN